MVDEAEVVMDETMRLGGKRCKDFSSLEQGEVWGEAAVRNWVLSSVR